MPQIAYAIMYGEDIENYYYTSNLLTIVLSEEEAIRVANHWFNIVKFVLIKKNVMTSKSKWENVPEYHPVEDWVDIRVYKVPVGSQDKELVHNISIEEWKRGNLFDINRRIEAKYNEVGLY